MQTVRPWSRSCSIRPSMTSTHCWSIPEAGSSSSTHVGLGGQHPGQGDELLLPERQGAAGTVGVGVHADERQPLQGALPRLALGPGRGRRAGGTGRQVLAGLPRVRRA